jgi:aspartate aminotransferase
MASYLDSIQFSGIIRVRDMMFTVADPFRLDQGDVSFDSPATVKDALARAIVDNRSHYVQSAGVPRLRELLASKLRDRNSIPVENDHVLVAGGGIHGVYVACQALLEPGDEVVIPDPMWPQTAAIIQMAHAVPVRCALREELGWRWDLDELESKLTPKTRAIYLNTPGNPTGGVFTRADLERIAAVAARRGLWILSDEAYEDIVFEGEHVSIASLPGMYERTIPIYTFSKSYAMTGLRLGYVAIRDPRIRERATKLIAYTASNISSLIQYGGIGALEGDQECIRGFRDELRARRDVFFSGAREASGGALSGTPSAGAFYAFMRIDPARFSPQSGESLSWFVAERLIKEGRIGCVPGVDFGPAGEGYIRFCFARDRRELTGAIESMRAVFSTSHAAHHQRESSHR